MAGLVGVGTACAAFLVLAPTRAGAAGGAGAGSPKELLPDLNMLEPRATTLESYDGHWVIAFGAAADNLGAGPLIVHASRPDTSTPMMTATQTVLRSDGTTATYPNAGQLEYVVEPDHQHWHYLGFMTYELRDVESYSVVRPSQKTGFCLLDDYRSNSFDPKHDPPNTPPTAVYHDDCDRNAPTALSVDEGISVGWGDYYNPLVEGQSIDLTGVPAGRYYLVVRVNQAHLLHESDTTNNDASLQLSLARPSGPDGKPVMTILATCRDGDHCLAPLALRVMKVRPLGRRARTLVVRQSLSSAGTVDVQLRVGKRIVAHVRRAVPAGSSTVSLPVPRNLHRPARTVLEVRAGGPGLKDAIRTLGVALR